MKFETRETWAFGSPQVHNNRKNKMSYENRYQIRSHRKIILVLIWCSLSVAACCIQCRRARARPSVCVGMPDRSAEANVTLWLLMLIMMLLLYHCDARPFGNCRAGSAVDNQQHSAIITACTSTVLQHRLATLDHAATSKTATTQQVPI